MREAAKAQQNRDQTVKPFFLLVETSQGISQNNQVYNQNEFSFLERQFNATLAAAITQPIREASDSAANM